MKEIINIIQKKSISLFIIGAIIFICCAVTSSYAIKWTQEIFEDEIRLLNKSNNLSTELSQIQSEIIVILEFKNSELITEYDKCIDIIKETHYRKAKYNKKTNKYTSRWTKREGVK